MLALGLAAACVLALLTVFAIELSGSRSTSRSSIEQTFHQRAVLRASLTQSLVILIGQFGAAEAASGLRASGPKLAAALADVARHQPGGFVAVLDPMGHMLAASPAITPAARAQLSSRPANIARVLFGASLSASGVLPIGPAGAGVIEYALPVSVPGRVRVLVTRPRSGRRRAGRTRVRRIHYPGTIRVLVTGLSAQQTASFLNAYLASVATDATGEAYVIDSHGLVVGGSGSAARAGAPVAERGLAAAVGRRVQGPFGAGRWFAWAPVAGTDWRIVLTASSGSLFASASGARTWIPWAIFAAFALVALLALLLGRRTLRDADQARRAKARIEDINHRLEHANDKLAHANDELGHANRGLAHANEELERANTTLVRHAAELARSNAELDQFASIASHDLQEPLRKVRTFLEKLCSTEPEHLTDRGRDYLDRANAAAERMQNLIEDLLKLSRVGTHGHTFAPVDLGRLVGGVLEDLDQQVQETSASVRVGGLPAVYGDESQLRQLMQNLISNALKFRRGSVAPVVSIGAESRGGVATITVRDNGIGFEPQYAGRIFGVFERLHGRGAYPGTGIGLALCRKIAERHGGTIEADGFPGAGATFRITLPLRQSEAGPVPQGVHTNSNGQAHVRA